MIARRVATALVVAGASLVATASAQGLGDTAARERAKRAEQRKGKQDARVFTNTDLEQGRPPDAKKAAESSESQPSGGTSVQSEEQPRSEESVEPRTLSISERAEQERSYLDAITAAQQGVSAAEGRVRQLQDKLNPMSISYIYGSGGSNDANEEIRVREELRQAEGILQGARQALGDANKSLQDFRQGRPSGR